MTISTFSTLEQLQALQNSFYAQLPGRIQDIDMAWRGLGKEGWNAKAANEMRRLLHNLTGSGGTFGLDGVSRAARETLIVLSAIIETARAPTSAQLLQMSQLLGTLREIALTEQPRPLVLPLKASSELRNLVYLFDVDEGFALKTSMQLRVFGYDVHIFLKLDTLKAALDQQLPAAILVDIKFEGDVPGTTGTQELQNHFPELPPLIFISGRDDFAARLGAARTGCAGYFTKPLNIPSLVDCLDYLTKTDSEEPYRILIVDDSTIDAYAHALHLQYAGFRTLTVSDPVIVTEKLTDFMPDMILMDLNMPECNGIELAAVIRQDVAFLATPIVFLSAEIDRERQFSVMKNGGDDFLVKPVKPSHLATLVQLRCGRGRMLRSHMVRDGLTGLLNHNRINERLTSEVARAIRQKSHLTIAMIDVDHLRSINSAHGHPVGDRVLKSLARLLQQRLRTTDLIGRFGGEEFIAIMIGAQADKAIEIMDEIRNSFEMVDQCSKSVEFTASISCGIATLNENSTAILMIEAAKDALGKAKKLGRNRVTVAN